MRYIIDIDLATVDTNSIFEDQTLGGAGNFTLNGVDVNSDGEWVVPDGFAHQISFESTGNLSGVTFTVTGFADKDRTVAISENITGPNNSTVESTEYFYYITQIASNGAVGTNVEAGFVDEAVTPAYPIDYTGGVTSVNLDITGTLDVTIQNTFDKVQDTTDLSFNWQDSPSVNLVNATTSTNDAYDGLPTALRAKINSYSTGAECQLVIQARYI